jgi:signal transduction histidine kinase
LRLRLRLAATAAVARQELNGVRAAAGPRLEEVDRALGGAGVRDVRHLELALLDPAAAPVPVGDLDRWRAGLTARAAALRGLERVVAGDLAEASGRLLADRAAGLRDRLVLLGLLVVASLAAARLLWRSPLGGGPAGQDESMVPGLARRGQALAARQLQLLGELAADEPDRHRRQALLGVDHLASRLRRTVETLVAVAGAGPAGRWAHPVPMNVVLRAAVAEADPGGPSGGAPAGDGARVGDGGPTGAVGPEGMEGTKGRGRPAGPEGPEGPEAPRGRGPVGRRRASVGRGPRVDLLTTGEVQIEGPAGTDLAHLLAELLDNAAAYSPPTAPIAVTGAADGDDYLIEVSDRGLGMTDQELAWANQRLATAARAGAGAAVGTSAAAGTIPVDPAGHAVGERLGLAVAGRLADRNGFGVRLGRSPAGGVTAAVRVPARLLSARAAAPVRPG